MVRAVSVNEVGGTGMHSYYPERAAYEKIAEARAAAARDRLAAIAERVGCKARQTAGSRLTRLLQTLAATFQVTVKCGMERSRAEGDRVLACDADGDDPPGYVGIPRLKCS